MKKFFVGTLVGFLLAALVIAGGVIAQPLTGGLVCGPVGIGCFILRTVQGTAASPAQTSITDATTGDFYSANGYANVAASGVEVFRWNSAATMQAQTVLAQASATGVTLTAAQLLGGIINRTGVGASQTDTTDTAANLYTAMGSPPVGMSFSFLYNNNQATNTVTLAGGSGVTLVGSATLAVSAQRRVTCVVTAVTPTFTCYL